MLLLRGMQLAGRLGLQAGRPANAFFFKTAAPLRLLASGAQAAPPKKGGAPVPVEPVYEEEEEDEDFNLLDSYNAWTQRRILALKDVQSEYDSVARDYLAELAALQAKYEAKHAPQFDLRREIIAGRTKVNNFDVQDDEEADSAIKSFWLNALSNHEKISPFITERDAEVLTYLEDVRAQVLTGEERGFHLYFHFRENPFFTNKVLQKTYYMEAEEDFVPSKFIGCKIDWVAGKDVTVEVVKKRAKGPKGDKAAAKAFVTETKPCDSFFNIFTPPQIPKNPDALTDEEMEDLQNELTDDFDIGYAIKDQVIPRAVEWFTGEIAPVMDYDEYEEGEEEDYDDLPAPPPPPQGGRNNKKQA